LYGTPCEGWLVFIVQAVGLRLTCGQMNVI